MLRLGAVLAVSLAACGGPTGTPTEEPPDDEPFIEGPVTDVSPFTPVTENCVPADQVDPDGTVSSDDPPVCTSPDAHVVGSLLVQEAGGGNQAVLTVTRETQVLEEFGGGYEPGDFARLRPGQTVAAWVSGPVAESFPVQATADALLIRGE